MNDALIGIGSFSEQLMWLKPQQTLAALAGELHDKGFVGATAVNNSRQVVHQRAQTAFTFDECIFGIFFFADIKTETQFATTVR